MNDVHGGIVAGWYPDPAGRFELRYHNGTTWTADVSTNGTRYVDPAGTAPPAPRPGPPPGATPGPPPGLPPGPSPTSSNGQAITAMVLGIVSIAVGWLPFIVVVGAVAAILAIVFGFIGRARAKRTGRGAGFALTGVITGFVGVLVCVGGVLFTIAFVRELDRYSNPAPNSVVIDSCTLDGSIATTTGEITNLGDEPADFSLRIAFVRPGTDNPDRMVRVPVEDVPPGATVPFRATRAVSLAEVDCLVQRIDGPLPFGVEVEN